MPRSRNGIPRSFVHFGHLATSSPTAMDLGLAMVTAPVLFLSLRPNSESLTTQKLRAARPDFERHWGWQRKIWLRS